MDNKKPTWSTMLGTLTDRSLTMPFVKLQVIKGGRIARYDGCNYVPEESLTKATDDAATFLVKCLSPQSGFEELWSPARLAVDQAGEWWSKSVDDFMCLSENDRDKVRQGIRPCAAAAAHELETTANRNSWIWLLAQPSLVTPRLVKFANQKRFYPALTRPDLVAGLSPERCLLIDLKTTSRELHELYRSDFKPWIRAFEQGMGFKVDQCWYLVVQVKTKKTGWFRA